jgi:hypothetical protein
MRQGKTLMELAQEVTRIQKSAVDFRLPTAALTMTDTNTIAFGDEKIGNHEFALNDWSHQQMSGHVEVPKGYYDRLRQQNPALLAQNVNHGLRHKVENKDKQGRLIRVLDGKVRGYLSTSYKVMDSHDILEAVLPTLMDNDFEVVSSEVTEKRMYLKTTSPKIQGEVIKGDVVQYGVMVSTSDVGAGLLNIEPYINTLACTNGMVMSTTFKKAHLGRNTFTGYIEQIMSENTRDLNSKAFFATLSDYLKSTMRPEIFQQQIELMKTAAGRKIETTDLEQVIEMSMKAVGQTGENLKKSLLFQLATGNEGKGLTQYGLANTFTAVAKDETLSYDQSTELERAGGLILELNQTQWKRIAG